MKRPSIGLLMTVVLLVAVDFAVLKALWRMNGTPVTIGLLTLPMGNLLLLVLRRAKGGQAAGRFWIGFEAAGWGMIFLLTWCIWNYDEWALSPVSWLAERLNYGQTPASMALIITLSIAAYTIPQLLIATGVGLLGARYRVVIERRRPTSLDHEGGPDLVGEAR